MTGTTPPSAAPSVLVVEDDESTGEAIAFHLGRAGLRATVAGDGLAALTALRREVPDVLVLDLMLPHLDGWYLIREVRDWAPLLPIIVVTARAMEHERVEVLALGADDVMAKPFSMRELRARVRAALRRREVEASGGPPEPVAVGELVVDPELLAAWVAGRTAELTPLEFRLLWLLAEHRGRALTRDEIYRRVWGGERGHGDRSVDVLVRRLRRKVDEVEGGRFTYVQTAHGVGYRLEAHPRVPCAPESPSAA
ncbi:MAG TPA: response regulator transcription factor [Vicinamibacteria bacterium]|jgi:two-component system OmpR family response regulator/two-component system alkaline phosphatase synthesis response regulator PhoP